MSTEDTGVKPETGADNKALNSNTNQQDTQQGNDLQTEVEKLRKEREQIEMERNLLRKKLEAEEKAKAEAEAKQLEEQQEFKTLYEQEKQRREQIEREQAEKEEKLSLASAKETALSEFSPEVRELAQELGFELTSADDDAVEAFKGKLSKVQERISSEQKVTPNNPSSPRKPGMPTGDDLRVALKDPQSFDEIVANMPGIAGMMTPKK